MRVLHITTEYPPLVYGGLGTAVGGLVSASISAGMDVAVLLVGYGSSPGYAAPERSAAPDGNAMARRKHGPAIWGVPHTDAIEESVRFARRWRPDVIHLHVFWLAHVAAAVRRATGAPLVYTVHSLDRAEYELGQGPPECMDQWKIQSDLIHDATRIIALTEAERELIEEYCPASRSRIRVVGNGISDTAHARKHARRSQRPNPVTILYTGRFVDRKGIRELLLAAANILRAEPGVRFVMAGGHRGSAVADMVNYWLPPACEAVQDRILFTGWLDAQQMASWYAAADILVVPSWYEPFGMVILEGMLYGLPIVASRVGGPKEILSAERTGLFCEAKDVGSLEAQIIRLIRDPALRLRLGREAATEVRSRWLHEEMMCKFQDVYREVAA